MIRPNVFLFAALALLGTESWAADFDRQTFLAAVKERFRSEPNLLELRSIYDPVLRIEPFPSKTQGWQKDLVAIPAIRQNATFGIALAYLASKELGIQFSGRGGPFDSVVSLDANGVIFSLNQVPAWGDVLLRTVFDEKSSCAIDRNVFRNTRADLDFANSICRDLKEALLEAKSEIKDQQQLTTEKTEWQAAIRRTKNLLGQAAGYENQSVVQASIVSLESALSGSNLSEIRAEAQGLTVVNRDLEQFIAARKTKMEALANTRQAANVELTRTQSLLAQAQGYGKQNQVASAQKPLELALMGENPEDIKGKTEALAAVNRDLDRFIQDQKTAAEKKRQQENDIRALFATKQRAQNVIDSATVELQAAEKYSGDSEVVAASRSTSKTMNELSLKVRSSDPKDDQQISKLTDQLGAEQKRLKALALQTTMLSGGIGKRVYAGCSVWAKRKGLTSTNSVRVFKDDATNQAADLATNMGTHLCRCMTVEIFGDREITDEAKLEIARQFETRDRMDNQQLALVVAVAGAKCQMQITKEIAK